MEGCMDERKTHHQGYFDVINHPIWEKTTNAFKAFNLQNYKGYLERETDQKLDGKMLELYNQYIQYYKKPQ